MHEIFGEKPWASPTLTFDSAGAEEWASSRKRARKYADDNAADEGEDDASTPKKR